MARTALFADPAVQNHDPGFGHPEQPARFRAVISALEHANLRSKLHSLPPRSATNEELRLVHKAEYVALVGRETRSGRQYLSTGDTNIMRHSDAAARIAVGGVLAAIDAVCNETVQNAFVAVRPPGHHATPSRGMGFCLYNNVAVGARYAQQRYGLQRIAIADWDVHHGNGTQDAFYQDGSVLFFSTHEWPLYPGTGAAEETGAGDGAGLTLNCPFPAGAGRKEIVGAFRDVLIPALNRFEPELILLSAGFDSRAEDPLGHFQLTDDDFRELTALVLESAARHCKGRLVSALEGGYNLTGLGLAAAAHVSELAG